MTVFLVAHGVGHVLLDAAAVSDVQDLHPPTNSEYGHSTLDGGSNQREFVSVATSLDLPGRRVRLFAVERRVHITRPAGKDEGVDEVQ
jgi:hypothetical protein